MRKLDWLDMFDDKDYKTTRALSFSASAREVSEKFSNITKHLNTS